MPEKEMTTNLPLTLAMRREIMKHGIVEGRTLKPQIRQLLKEALAARKAVAK